MAAKTQKAQPDNLAVTYLGPYDEVEVYNTRLKREIIVKRNEPVEFPYEQALNLKLQSWDGSPEDRSWKVPGISDADAADAHKAERVEEVRRRAAGNYRLTAEEEQLLAEVNGAQVESEGGEQ